MKTMALEKLDVESYPRNIRQRQTMTTDLEQFTEADEWERLPYRPRIDCPVCKGFGFLHRVVNGKPLWGEKLIPCAEPGCLSESIKASNGQVFPQTFENFVTVPGTEKALKLAKELAYGHSQFIWLVMFGPCGNGKTHLCNAIVRTVRDRNLDVRMILAADLFSALREAMTDNKTDEALRRYKDIFFLVIDDYGTEYGSEWEQAKFDELMTSRFATGKPTVVATNKDISELSARLKSRFEDKVLSRICHNSAPDYRRTKKAH